MMNTPPMILPSDAAAIGEGCYWDGAKAEKAIGWIESNLALTLYKWQRDILTEYFGWRRPGGRYRFTKIHVWISKKNGKSLLASVIAGYKLFELRDKKIFSGAYCAKQAALVMHGLISCCKRSKKLRPLMKKRTGVLKAFCTKFRRDFTNELTDCIYEALADGVSSNDGIVGDVMIIDEIHRMKEAQIDVLMGATSKIPNALTVIISTAGDGNKEHRAWKIYEDDKRILSGVTIDTTTLPVIHEYADAAALKGEEIYDIDVVVAANPVLQEDPEKRELAKVECEENRRLRRDAWWRRFQLGQWLTQDGESYIDAALYDACEVTQADAPNVDGCEAYIGLDKTGGVWDLTALAFLFPLDDGRLFERHFTFASADRIAEMTERDEHPYIKDIDAGELIVIPAEAVADEWLYEWCEAEFAKYNIKKIAADPYNAAFLLEKWKAEGLDVVAVQQSNNKLLTQPINDYIKHIHQKRITHLHNGLVSWQLSCTRKITTAKDCSKLVKAGTNRRGQGGKGHIDNLDALINGLAAWRVDEIAKAATGNGPGIYISSGG